MSLDRRRFLTLTGLGLVSTAGSWTIGRTLAEDGPLTPPASSLTAQRWAMVVDLRVCAEREDLSRIAAACHRAHNVPHFDDARHEVKWIWPEPFEHAFPDQVHEYTADRLRDNPVLVFCNHCDHPPCVKVCPTQATWKRERDGIVMMDWHRCIGCRYCMAACPYGSRSFNWLDPRPEVDEIDPSFPTRTRGVVEKCNFCEERLARGELPACVEACEHGGMIFGDLEDPESEVRRVLRERVSIRRRPELGTHPEVFYLVDDPTGQLEEESAPETDAEAS